MTFRPAWGRRQASRPRFFNPRAQGQSPVRCDISELEAELDEVCGGITVSSGVKRLVAVLLVHPLFSVVPLVFSIDQRAVFSP